MVLLGYWASQEQYLCKPTKPKISYSGDYDEAVRACEFWRASLIENVFDLDISDPIELQEKATQEISDDKLKQSILIATKIDDLIKPIQEYFESGLLKYLHTVQVPRGASISNSYFISVII